MTNRFRVQGTSPIPRPRILAHRVRAALLATFTLVGAWSPAAWPGTHSRLGAAEVQSPLGSPLRLRIPLESTDGFEGAGTSSRFSLGASPENAAVPFIENAEITLELRRGQHFLVIRSRRPIDEPAIGLVIREQLPGGIRSREYLLLLDPPAAFKPPSEDGDASTARAVTTSPAFTPSSAAVADTVAAATSRPLAVPARPAERAASAARRARAPASAQSGNSHPGRGKTRASQGFTLSLSTGDLAPVPAADETMRARLRERRQLTLDLDDLTSVVLQRRHRIAQLEAEVAHLETRIHAASERAEAIAALGLPPAAVMPATAEPSVTVVPTLAPVATAESQAVASSSAAKVGVSRGTAAMAQGAAIVIGALFLLTALFWLLRHGSRRRADKAIDDLSRDIAEPAPQAMSVRDAESRHAVATAAVPAESAPAVRYAGDADIAVPDAEILPEIHFELPTLRPATAAPVKAGPAIVDMHSRRLRYLQTRYQEVAVMKPALDAPPRLLARAGGAYDEGAVDFAKRLLKYATYSRPQTQEYWLALLELLYREKFANDYTVNAKWFQTHHPLSPAWPEVQRIGALLDAAEPLFAGVGMSREPPRPGKWLPLGREPAKEAAAAPLRLELVG